MEWLKLGGLALAISAFLGCSLAGAERFAGGQGRDLSSVIGWAAPRWDSPARARNPIPNKARFFQRLAISADGAWIALPSPADPSNQLMVFNWRTMDGFSLRYPAPMLELIDPAFAPDLKSVALVATPAPRYGWGEIWRVDMQGALIDRVPGCQRSYQRPSFSPDGRRVAFFVDLWRAEDDTTPELFPGHPEYRSLTKTGQFIVEEFDFSTRTQSRPVPMGWLFQRWLAYDLRGDTLFVGGSGQLGRMQMPSGAWMWAGEETLVSKLFPFADPKNRAAREAFLSGARITDLRRASPTIAPFVDAPGASGLVGEKALILDERRSNGRVVWQRLLWGPSAGAATVLEIDATHRLQFDPVMSANECVVAYPFGIGEGLVVETTHLRIVNRCGEPTDETRAIADILARLPTKIANWRFGDACKQ